MRKTASRRQAIDTDDSPDLAIDSAGPIPDARIFYQGKVVGQVVGNYPQEIMDAIQEVVDDPSAAIAIVPTSCRRR